VILNVPRQLLTFSTFRGDPECAKAVADILNVLLTFSTFRDDPECAKAVVDILNF
jgi:hypothetical protein